MVHKNFYQWICDVFAKKTSNFQITLVINDCRITSTTDNGFKTWHRTPGTTTRTSHCSSCAASITQASFAAFTLKPSCNQIPCNNKT